MIAERPVFYGIVRDGIVVLAKDVLLPDGATVEIQVVSATDAVAAPPDEFAAEMAGWDRASQDAWAMIEEWERGSVPERAKT